MVYEPGAEDTAGNFALNMHEIRAKSLTFTEAQRRPGICLYLQKPVPNYPYVHKLNSKKTEMMWGLAVC